MIWASPSWAFFILGTLVAWSTVVAKPHGKHVQLHPAGNRHLSDRTDNRHQISRHNHASELEETTKWKVIISTTDLASMGFLASPSSPLTGNVQFTHAGGLLDLLRPEKPEQRKAPTMHELVYGQRDLNALRFFTEASEQFFEFVKQVVATPNSELRHKKLQHLALRLFYWKFVHHAHHPQEQLDAFIKRLTQVVDANKAAQGSEQYKTSLSNWIYFLAYETMGYSKQELNAYAPPGTTLAELIQENARKWRSPSQINIKDAKAMIIFPEDCQWLGSPAAVEPLPTCAGLVSHSGLADVATIRATAGKHPLSNPYGLFSPRDHGIQKATEVINKVLAKSVDEFQEGFHERDEKENSNLIAGVNQLIEQLKEEMTHLTHLNIKQVTYTPGTSLLDYLTKAYGKDVAEVLATPLARKGEVAMSASCPYPPRSAISLAQLSESSHVCHGVNCYHSPGVTTNNNLDYYVSIHRTLNDFIRKDYWTRPSHKEASQKLAHICDAYVKGLRYISLSNVFAQGPIVIRFAAVDLVKLCPERPKSTTASANAKPSESDVFVIMIDMSRYQSLIAPTASTQLEKAFFATDNLDSFEVYFTTKAEGGEEEMVFKADLGKEQLPISGELTTSELLDDKALPLRAKITALLAQNKRSTAFKDYSIHYLAAKRIGTISKLGTYTESTQEQQETSIWISAVPQAKQSHHGHHNNNHGDEPVRDAAVFGQVADAVSAEEVMRRIHGSVEKARVEKHKPVVTGWGTSQPAPADPQISKGDNNPTSGFFESFSSRGSEAETAAPKQN